MNKLIAEISLHPCIYNEGNQSYTEEEKSTAWKNIASNIYQKQWNEFTLNAKLKKVKHLEKQWLELEPIWNLVSFKTEGEQFRGQQVKLGKSSECSRPNKPPIVQSTSKAQHPYSATIKAENGGTTRLSNYGGQTDKDEQLLVMYLLPIYKLLNGEDQRETLFLSLTIMQRQLHSYPANDTPIRIRNEEKPPKRYPIQTNEVIVISDDEQ